MKEIGTAYFNATVISLIRSINAFCGLDFAAPSSAIGVVLKGNGVGVAF